MRFQTERITVVFTFEPQPDSSRRVESIMTVDDLRMLRERIRHYRAVAEETTDPMARILINDLIDQFEEIQRGEMSSGSVAEVNLSMAEPIKLRCEER